MSAVETRIHGVTTGRSGRLTYSATTKEGQRSCELPWPDPTSDASGRGLW
jgi:hypothetical protein